MGLLYHLETQLECQIPAQLQAAPQQALDDYQPICDRCRLAMHRHHRYARAIATDYANPLADTCVPLRPVSPYGWRHDAAGRWNAPPAVFQKNRDIAISLAAQGLSYARAGNWVGCVSSTVCKWLQKAPLTVPQLPPDGTLELDGLWTRTRRGRAELKVIRSAAAGTALEAFVPWAEVIDRAWQLGAEHPEHLVSDGNGAIAAGIGLVYGGEGHISCARFACCGSICGTLGARDLRRRGC